MQLSKCDLPTQGVDFGQRPGLIVVDMSVGFTSPNSPLGGQFESEVACASWLVEQFYRANLPVFFSTVVYDTPQQQSVFRTKLPALDILQRGTEWVNIDASLQVRGSHHIIEKTAPSAFFCTQLDHRIRTEKADCLMICGLTTSGCVRATVVDALSYNYPVWVVEEACGDRNSAAHTANLHDLHAKYAQVVSRKKVNQYFTEQFDSAFKD